MERPQEVLEELRLLVAANKLQNVPLEDLKRYVDALNFSNAVSYFGASQFYQVCETLRTMLAVKLVEEQAAQRHEQIRTKLIELKKPHRPSFWLLVASVTLAFVAAAAAILAVPQVQKAVFGNPQPQEKTEQSQSNEYKSQSQKPATPKR